MAVGRKTLMDIYETPRAVDSIYRSIPRIRGLAEEVYGEGPRKFFFIGCGSSYYAAMYAALPILNMGGYTAYPQPSSEVLLYTYRAIDSGSVAVAISRSGRTAETLTALKRAKERGATTIIFSITRPGEVPNYIDRYIYIDVGGERSVVMTKSFTSLSLAAWVFSSTVAGLSRGEGVDYGSYVLAVRGAVEELLDRVDALREVSMGLIGSGIGRAVFLGQGPSYPIALEAALKLKETSYIATEALHALEFRHGPMATVGEEQVLVFINPGGGSFNAVRKLYLDMVGRGARTILLTDREGSPEGGANVVVEIPELGVEDLVALTAIVPLQLIAYYYAVGRGRDPDAPRNLVRFVGEY
ncbi:MAG: hypothetical protein B6U73_05015 [Desulfurococcales archaeon ex4484_204]|nr:MAG: hypothetical protein B6U73_05015 [Desulfurococcales archaeon ex4484_204]